MQYGLEPLTTLVLEGGRKYILFSDLRKKLTIQEEASQCQTEKQFTSFLKLGVDKNLNLCKVSIKICKANFLILKTIMGMEKSED